MVVVGRNEVAAGGARVKWQQRRRKRKVVDEGTRARPSHPITRSLSTKACHNTYHSLLYCAATSLLLLLLLLLLATSSVVAAAGSGVLDFGGVYVVECFMA
jgi:hypothetical protein